MGAGLIMQLHGDADDGATFGGEIVAELIERFGWCGDGRGDCTIGRFAEFGFEAADDGDDAGVWAEEAQEELAAGGLGERELGAGVDGAEVVEVLGAGGKAEELRGVRGGLDAEEGVEGELGDAVLHEGHGGWRAGDVQLVNSVREGVVNYVWGDWPQKGEEVGKMGGGGLLAEGSGCF